MDVMLFANVISKILSLCGITCDMVADECSKTHTDYFSADAIRGWRTKRPPSTKNYSLFIETMESMLSKKEFSYISKETIINDVEDIFASNNLLSEWNSIKSSSNEETSLIIGALNLAYYKTKEWLRTKKELPPKQSVKKLVAFDLDGTLIKGIKIRGPFYIKLLAFLLKSVE